MSTPAHQNIASAPVAPIANTTKTVTARAGAAARRPRKPKATAATSQPPSAGSVKTPTAHSFAIPSQPSLPSGQFTFRIETPHIPKRRARAPAAPAQAASASNSVAPAASSASVTPHQPIEITPEMVRKMYSFQAQYAQWHRATQVQMQEQAAREKAEQERRLREHEEAEQERRLREHEEAERQWEQDKIAAWPQLAPGQPRAVTQFGSSLIGWNRTPPATPSATQTGVNQQQKAAQQTHLVEIPSAVTQPVTPTHAVFGNIINSPSPRSAGSRRAKPTPSPQKLVDGGVWDPALTDMMEDVSANPEEDMPESILGPQDENDDHSQSSLPRLNLPVENYDGTSGWDADAQAMPSASTAVPGLSLDWGMFPELTDADIDYSALHSFINS
ncbi:unnamed protein product [Mycena citricolor]|uniref:Uncharacterized protein n=1 Tax=Mycena citricolor TaxID=2018698 RepID=A0AAD2GZ85_9AGAR|nr:unnamed protein product [Mycena citricolor]